MLQSLFVLLATYCISSAAAPPEGEKVLTFLPYLPCALSFSLLTVRVDSVNKKRFYIGDNVRLLPQQYKGYFKNAIFFPAIAVIAFVYLCNTLMIPNCNLASRVEYVYPFFFMFVLLTNMTAAAHYLGLQLIKAHTEAVVIDETPSFVTPLSTRFVHNSSFQVARPARSPVALLPPAPSPILIPTEAAKRDSEKDSTVSKTILLHHDRVPVEVSVEMIMVAYLDNRSVIVTLTNGVQRRYTGVLKELGRDLSIYPNFFVTGSWVANLLWVDRLENRTKSRAKDMLFKVDIKVRLTVPRDHVADFRKQWIAIVTEGKKSAVS